MKKLLLIITFLLSGAAMGTFAQPRPPRPPLPPHHTTAKKKPVKKVYKYKKPKKHSKYYSKSHYNSREQLRRGHSRKVSKARTYRRPAHPLPPRPPHR